MEKPRCLRGFVVVLCFVPRKGRTYEKEYKDLNVPDKPHPALVVLTVVADAGIGEVHVPSEPGITL